MNSRLISLDFFRGLTIAAMIVVNDPGSWSYVYPPLRHGDKPKVLAGSESMAGVFIMDVLPEESAQILRKYMS